MSSKDTAQREAGLRRVRDYRADLANLKSEIGKAAASTPGGAAARAELGLGSDLMDTSQAQRDRLLTTTDRLQDQGGRIKQGRQQLLQAEELGVVCGPTPSLPRARPTSPPPTDPVHGQRSPSPPDARRRAFYRSSTRSGRRCSGSGPTCTRSTTTSRGGGRPSPSCRGGSSPTRPSCASSSLPSSGRSSSSLRTSSLEGGAGI